MIAAYARSNNSGIGHAWIKDSVKHLMIHEVHFSQYSRAGGDSRKWNSAKFGSACTGLNTVFDTVKKLKLAEIKCHESVYWAQIAKI